MCHVPGPRGNSLGYFLPQQGIVSMFFSGVGRQPISAPAFLFLVTNNGSRGCNAAGCANTNGHRPTNTRSSFSAPEAVLSEVEQRFGCVRTGRSASRLTGQNVRVLHYPLYDFDLRATHARTLLPAALASVSFGFVLVRVRLCLGSNSLAI